MVDLPMTDHVLASQHGVFQNLPCHRGAPLGPATQGLILMNAIGNSD